MERPYLLGGAFANQNMDPLAGPFFGLKHKGSTVLSFLGGAKLDPQYAPANWPREQGRLRVQQRDSFFGRLLAGGTRGLKIVRLST